MLPSGRLRGQLERVRAFRREVGIAERHRGGGDGGVVHLFHVRESHAPSEAGPDQQSGIRRPGQRDLGRLSLERTASIRDDLVCAAVAERRTDDAR